MRSKTLALSSGDRSRSPNQPNKETPKAPPRHRLLGGDIARGGIPAAIGHAGRGVSTFAFARPRHLPTGPITSLCLLGILCTVFVCMPSPALAATSISFPNGGTATLNADGTITGKAWVGEWDDELSTHFPVVMPDGAHKDGWCQNTGHYAPSSGNHPFVATPRGDGSYDVLIDTTTLPPNPRQIDLPSVLPTQAVGGFTWSPVITGKLKVAKSSSLTNITNGNSCYSIANARYTVWKDSACTQCAGTLETNEAGSTAEITLNPGTYWVKETGAPKGYRTDNKAHKVDVSAGQTRTVSLEDVPAYEAPGVWANKQDAQYQDAQGWASLEGAEFTIRYYDGSYDLNNLPDDPTRTWVVRSDDQGNVIPTDKSFVRGGAFYRNENNEVVLPLGTITIQETKAPAGYWLEGQNADSAADYTAPLHLTHVSGEGGYETPVVKEQVRRAGLSLRKVDSQTGTQAQGDASLEGIAFEVINRNKQAVVVDNIAYDEGQTVTTISTDAQGMAHTAPDCLPLGTYEVRESATNDSMLLTCSPQTLALDVAHTNQIVPLSAPMANDVVRGGIKVGKISRETGQHLTQGEAVLSGAVLSVTLDSQQPVIVNGTQYGTGEVVCTLTTDKDGMAQTDDHALPYGTYTIREEEAPLGFLRNETWSSTVSIREDGVIEDVSGEADSVDDQVMRGSFSFNKVDESSMERMANVAWLVTSVTTGERHVMVCNENGIADTEASNHSKSTNTNDSALADGVVDVSALDPHAGLWFSGRDDLQTEPNDDLCALPYDVYTVQELRSAANEGHDLVAFTVRVHEHDVHINMGSIDNKRTETPAIHTSLTYGGSDHVAPASERIQLVDTVSYQGLKVNEEYTLEGELHYQDTGAGVAGEDGKALVATTTFTPTTSAGTAQVTFELDSSALAGSSVVAYERLLHGSDEVASHADQNDEGQTVHFPKIGTTLDDGEGNKEVAPHERIRLVDTVSYANLVPGIRYELEGTLMDKESGEPLRDDNGREIRASSSFVPTEPAGTEEVAFEFVGNVAEGKSLIAFETLLRAGVEVASHADANDEGQTVVVPSIHTTLADEHSNQVIDATGTVRLVDTITYEGLEPNATYTATGTLMDKATGEALKDASGQEVHATTTFTPTEASGTTTVTFEVDATLVCGTQVVAYESLRRGDREIVVHADLEDESQTAHFPLLHTTLLGAQGTHEVEQDNITLTDTVAYEGLRPNVPYTLVGTLMDKSDGKPLQDSDGKAYTSTMTFTPSEPKGTVELTFALNTRNLGGHAIVAFEFLHEGETQDGRQVATHANIDSAEQTVFVPNLHTTASNRNDSSKKIASDGVAHVRDVVLYEGLVPQASYTIEGTLYNKDTGDALQGKDGKPLSSRTTFTAQEKNGSVDVDFDFDASEVSGSGVVVFETCLREGRVVARHGSLSDEDQTVLIDRPANKKDKESRDEKEASSRNRTPGTGDYGQALLLAAALAVFGASLLIARHLLR
ncbi:MAG: VaFE repeat-containing surface-anchored protein [Atopobiaceae bacterium]|nr:VaFE repeat-containing surface-anchored protein [Atopobiaceae bacterium]